MIRIRAILGLMTASALGGTASAKDFYVAPVGSGLLCTAASPCSIDRAQDLVRRAIKTQRADIHVRLTDGTYSLTKPLALTRLDSGRNGFRVFWEAAPGARPILSGGTSFAGWQLYDPARNVWRAAAPTGLNSRQLYIDGKRAQRATTSDLLRSGFEATERGYRFADPITGRPIDISNFKNITDVEVVRSQWWQLSRCRVTEATATEIHVNPICLANSKTANVTIFIENAYELLKKPGEWYLDRSGAVSGRPSVYYIPRPGENMNSARGVMGSTERLMTITGDGPRSKAHDITIRGLTFAYGTWHDDRGPVAKVGGYAGLQAGVYMLNFADFLRADADPNPGSIPQPAPVAGGFYDAVNLAYLDYIPAAMTVNFAARVNIEENVFAHLGYTAVAMIKGIEYSSITGNQFFDISGSAIQLGGIEKEDRHPCGEEVDNCQDGRITHDNIVSNNQITTIGADYFDAVAIFVGYTRNSVVRNNDISQIPYTAISSGWGWGWFDKDGILETKAPTIMGGNKVLRNRIGNFLLKQRDGGGVYTLSAQPNSEIAGNYIFDGRNDWAGIYQDEGTSGFHVHNNVIVKVNNSVLIHCGRNDVTTGNVYERNYSDSGAVRNSCARGKNIIEAPISFTDRFSSDADWPSNVRTIIAAAGVEPQNRKFFDGLPKTGEFSSSH